MFILKYERMWPVLANSQIEINPNSISGSFQNGKAKTHLTVGWPDDHDKADKSKFHLVMKDVIWSDFSRNTKLRIKEKSQHPPSWLPVF